MFVLRTLKIPVHYSTTKLKLYKLDRLTRRLSYTVKLWSKLIDDNNIRVRRELQDLRYQHYVQEKTRLSSGFVQQAGNKAFWVWKSYRKKLKQNSFIQKPFSKNKRIAVRIDYRTGSIKKVSLKLASYGVELSTLKKHEKLFLLLNPSEYHLKKLSEGKIQDFEIIKKKGKYFVYVVCGFEVEEQKPEKIRGIDLGINRSITTVLLSKTEKPQINILIDKQKQELLTKYNELIARLQQVKKKKKLKQLSDKRKRIAEYFDRVLAKQLSKLSGENEIVAAGYPYNIRAKNMRGNYNKRLREVVHQWSFSRLLKFITEKYEEKGMRVLLVSEKFTSKKCCFCSSMNTERPTQPELHCKNCNAKIDADVNAAINIALSVRNATDELAATDNDFLYKGLKSETNELIQG